MQTTKRERLMKKIENHLRITSRQLAKFDTEEETLHYVLDSFRSELLCDFVGIILKDKDYLIPKASSGGSVDFIASFPLKIEDCSPDLLAKSLTIEKTSEETHCQFSKLLFQEKISTWFTLPITEGTSNLGFCVIGFTTSVPLFLEMDDIFSEFGKDVAVSISLAKSKEAQKKKIMGLEWLGENLFLDSSIEKLVERIVECAGKRTQAKGASIYLFDELKNCFVFQAPAFGNVSLTDKILIENDYVLKNHFPYLEVPGGNQLTVPLIVDLKTIGVLHVENKENGMFTMDDYEILDILSNHVAALLENARLYKNEREHKQQFRSLLEYQQSLIKETVEQEDFDGITSALSKLFNMSVILFDRFMRPITHHLINLEQSDVKHVMDSARNNVMNGGKYFDLLIPIADEKKICMRIWPINGGRNLLGYLATEMPSEELDEYQRISIELSLNVYSVQFIKQKLVCDAREQVKDSFINKLLVENVEDQESIIQYTSLFNWDIEKQCRVSVLSIALDEKEMKDKNFLEQQEKKSVISDQLKAHMRIFHGDIFIANKGDEFVLVVPTEKEQDNSKKYWESLFHSLKKWKNKEKIPCQIYLGIGGKTAELQGYYNCYLQGVKVLQIILKRFKDIGFASFEELEAYTILHQLKDSKLTNLVINKHLGPLLDHTNQKNIDLFQTLRVFLNQNGIIKDTADTLYIHRSTLLYRIEKIQALLDIDINQAEHRFILMMAFKLYDLFHSKS